MNPSGFYVDPFCRSITERFAVYKKDPEFAPDKLRRNAIFCFRPETKKALILL